MTDFIIFGEILFDCFPDRATLGGAPLNVAGHMTRLGLKGKVVSAVGADELGRRAIKEIENIGLDTSDIAVLADAETGRADVTLHGKNAEYTFNDPAAWDMIPCPEDLDREAEVVYFGSLAQRSFKSRETLRQILSRVKARHIFYDVNIRKEFYTEEIIREGLKNCTILKMNDEEVPLITALAGCEDITDLMKSYSLSIVLLTEGKKGTTAITADGERYHADITDVPVVDTVGAGDSLSAGFLASLVKSGDIGKSVRAGSALADFVVSQRGALPEYDEAIKERLHKEEVL